MPSELRLQTASERRFRRNFYLYTETVSDGIFIVINKNQDKATKPKNQDKAGSRRQYR
ncbi:hypothetical protein [Neisseria meningitidis]|uniref:hypothetical protein n=1 Tax=Neisseria meningitidis TaxID=487 RepID=UPI000A468AD1|nr:hypothetical protein [Neisseria meningitidis]